jgi:hypothetical protein
MHTNYIKQALAPLTLGPDIIVRNLTMIPLLTTELPAGPPTAPAVERRKDPRRQGDAPARSFEYVTLDDAIAAGATEVREVSEGGSVPELRVVNRGTLPVLIVDGEELVGAKQNRVVNLSILVPADTDLIIPVSCVEAGRWRARSRAFATAPRAQYASGRAKRMIQVTESIRDRGVHDSDQAEVWADIAAKSARLEAKSPTSAMEALYLDHSSAIDAFVNGCQPLDRQVGALFSIAGSLVGFDLFDRESTLRKMLPKLVRSVAVDALDRATTERDAPPAPPISVRPLARLFLAAIGAAPVHQGKAVGLGEDLRLSSPGLTGAALVAEGAVVHLSAFQLQ